MELWGRSWETSWDSWGGYSTLNNKSSQADLLSGVNTVVVNP